ncbi:MAG: DUF7282 domain-containing protein, partial [Halodesulfurarchaeum sp.]
MASTHRTLGPILFTLLVIGQAGLAGVAITDTALAQEDVPEGSFDASSNTVTVTRGDSVDIEFSHSGPATLQVGGDDMGYHLEVEAGGSGSSTVTIDTYRSASANPNDYVSGGTPTLVDPADGLDSALQPGRYSLNLTVDGTTVDLGTLVIEEREETTVRTGTAPGSLDLDDADAEDVLDATTERERVAKGDLAVVAFEAEGLSEAIDTDRLDGGPGANGIEVHFEDASPRPNKPKQSFHATESHDTHVFYDEEEGTLVIAWETDDVELRKGTHRYDVSFAIRAEHTELLEDDAEDVEGPTGSIAVVEPDVDLDTADELTVYPWDDRQIRLAGSTTLAPGTTFPFRAQLDDPDPFFETATTTVEEDGTFATTISLAGVPRGTTLPVWILDHRDIAEWDVEIREATAELDLPEQTVEDGRTVRVEGVSLSVGGFVALEDEDGTVIGQSAYLDEGEHGTVEIRVDPQLERNQTLRAVAMTDRNGNESFEAGTDAAYEVDGSAVADEARVSVPKSLQPTPTT